MNNELYDVTTKRVEVRLTAHELQFVKWLAKHDRDNVQREMRKIFYTELNVLMGLYEDEFKNETGGE